LRPRSHAVRPPPWRGLTRRDSKANIQQGQQQMQDTYDRAQQDYNRAQRNTFPNGNPTTSKPYGSPY
jgi:hypothetical protein